MRHTGRLPIEVKTIERLIQGWEMTTPEISFSNAWNVQCWEMIGWSQNYLKHIT